MRNLLTACAVVVIILAMTGMAHAYDTVFVDSSYTYEPVWNPGLCYYTIQAGVDGVDPAGTVVVMGDTPDCPGCSSGIYNECVQIFGPGRDDITVCTYGDVELTACDGGSAFYITAANVTVTSGWNGNCGTFTINGDPDATAFMYEGAVGGLLENVSIDASNTALFMAFSDGITIRGNDVNCVPPPAGYIQEARFIEMTRTNDCLVEYNLANDFCTCIYLNDGDDTSMSNNRNIFQFNTLTHQPIMRDDQSDGRGFYIKDNCQDNQILNNTISGWCQFTQSAYAGHITGGIGLSTKADNPGRTIIVGNEITACGWGIELDSFGNTITDNLIHDLRLHTISGGGGYGLQFYYKRNSSYNTITSNEIYNNPYDGIRYRGSSVDLTGNVITCNQIYNNATGANGSALTLVQDLKGNWWGDATGPLDTKTLPGQPNYNNPGGLGNSVTSFIDYFPFKADPDGVLPYMRVQNQTQMTYYPDIQPALDAANPNDVIFCSAMPGQEVYTEDISMTTDGVALTTADSDTARSTDCVTCAAGDCPAAVIQGIAVLDQSAWPLAAPNIDIQADNVELKGFTIKSPVCGLNDYSSGVVFVGEGITIRNNCFLSQGDPGGPLGQNVVMQSYRNVAPGLDSLSIRDNALLGTPPGAYVGIFINHTLTADEYIEIKDNALSGNIIQGIITERSKTNILNNCMTTDAGSPSWGMIVQDFVPPYANQTNVNMEGNKVAGFETGIRVGPTSGQWQNNISITRCNEVVNNDIGIHVRDNADRVTVENNNIYNNIVGMSNTNTGTVSALLNFWGDNGLPTAGEPGVAGNNPVSGAAVTSPWNTNACSSSLCPYPVGDSAVDRVVDFFDLAKFAANWLVDLN